MCWFEANSTSQRELCWPLWLAATSPSGELCVSHSRPPNSLSLGIALKVPAYLKKRKKEKDLFGPFYPFFFNGKQSRQENREREQEITPGRLTPRPLQ